MHKMSNRRGFIHTRTIIALFITLSVLPLTLLVFRFVANMHFDYRLPSSEIAFMDLRRILLLAYDMDVSSDELNFIYHNDNYSLRLVNNKLILRPGTQIYIDGIEMVNFYTKNSSIYVYYIDEKGREYERNIGSQKRFYLNDFLDSDDEFIESNNSDE